MVAGIPRCDLFEYGKVVSGGAGINLWMSGSYVQVTSTDTYRVAFVQSGPDDAQTVLPMVRITVRFGRALFGNYVESGGHREFCARA